MGEAFLLFIPPGYCAAAARRTIYSAAVSYFLTISVRLIISKSSGPIGLRQIFTVGRTVAVADQSETSSLIP